MLPQSGSPKCHCSGIERPGSHSLPFPPSHGLRPFSLTVAAVFTSILYDSAHSTDFSFPAQGTQDFCLCFRKFDLVLRKQMSFFFSSSLSHDFQMLVHRAIALWAFWVWLFLSAPTSAEQSPLPHDHGALGPSFLKPALPVLSVFSEI